MNKQEIMVKYTKLVIERIYHRCDFEVYFNDYLIENEERWFCGQNNIQTENSITYNGTIYSESELYEEAWNTIVHEVTHIEVLWHKENFWNAFYKNLERVDDLRVKFNLEIGWDADFIYDYDDDEEKKMNMIFIWRHLKNESSYLS